MAPNSELVNLTLAAFLGLPVDVDLPSQLAEPCLDVFRSKIWSALSASNAGYARAEDPCVSGVATIWMSVERWT